MRILVLGSHGQVGWELLRTLAPLGEISGVDRDQIDIAHVEQFSDFLAHTDPDLIVNAAAYTAVDRAESEPDSAFAINATACETMAAHCKRSGAALVSYSTDYVFDGTSDVPYTEDASPAPLSVYGKSKLAGDEAIAAAGIPHLIFRTSWVYGARGKNFLLTMLKLGQERPELRIVNDQTGAPTWSHHIAHATYQVLAQVAGGDRDWSRLRGKSGIYNLTSAGRTTWFDFARAIFEIEGRGPALTPISTADYPTPAVRPKFSVLSGEKMAQVFGIRMPDWRAALEAVMRELHAGKSTAL